MLMLSGLNGLLVHQVHEMAELFGFETRNKYQIMDENKVLLAYAAEQQKGFLGFLFRQFTGHWRRFDIHFFNPSRQTILIARHPFRWFFQRLEISDGQGRLLGALQQRFSIFSKRFEVENERKMVILRVNSPLWRPWTFSFRDQHHEVAIVTKRWSGLLSEAFTDKDNFKLEFKEPALSEIDRHVLMAAAIFIDLQYFERKARSKFD